MTRTQALRMAKANKVRKTLDFVFGPETRIGGERGSLSRDLPNPSRYMDGFAGEGQNTIVRGDVVYVARDKDGYWKFPGVK